MKNIFVLLFLASFGIIHAQNIIPCQTNEYIDYVESIQPGTKSGIQNIFEKALTFSENNIPLKFTNSGQIIYRIPVVFHVLYNDTAENLSDDLLHNQIKVLNDDFRKLNADTINTRSIFKDRAADVGLEFFLATLDPNGNITNGIIRKYTSKEEFGDPIPAPSYIDSVKHSDKGGNDGWDPDNYLNIWVCNIHTSLFGQILGYAYPPISAPNWPASQIINDKKRWGVVLHFENVGKDNPFSIPNYTDQGRTAVHEVGHFFGLRHTWGDPGGTAVNCDITRDDGISDTPHSGENSQGSCDFAKNSCTNGENPDEPDMVENYMDYSTEVCQNMFTQGQADLMRTMAEIGRSELPEVIIDEILDLQIGDYIVINNTDTIVITSNSNITISPGDQIIFLNENNGYHYTASNDFIIYHSTEISVTEDGEIINIASGLQDFEKENMFTIFPNPSTQYISIHSNDLPDRVLITNTVGKVVLDDTKKSGRINIENIPNGVYFIQFLNGQKIIESQKIIIKK